jgi:hypothetical protein
MNDVPNLLPKDADRVERIRVYKARWRAKNNKRELAACKAWRDSHPEKRAGYRDNAAAKRRVAGQMPYHTEYGRANRAKSMFYAAQYRAKKKGIEFSITKEDVIIPEFCPVFGMRLETSPGVGRSDASPSLDRIDNTKGYLKGNVIVVSWLANRIKSDATVEQLRIVASFYGSCQTSSSDLRR